MTNMKQQLDFTDALLKLYTDKVQLTAKEAHDLIVNLHAGVAIPKLTVLRTLSKLEDLLDEQV